MKDEDKVHDYWQSYSDLMAALLLMFALLIVIMIYKYAGIAAELSLQKAKVDDLIGVRARIIDQLFKEFNNSDMTLSIDPQTGAISFSEGVFFDKDKFELKEEGKRYLNEFIPRYLSILMDPRFKKYISQIIVEGHTDDTGDYMYNLELSQKRAFEVVRYILQSNIKGIDSKTKADLMSYITANGRSYSQLIIENGKVNRQKSRRVEFKFRLKEEEMIMEMQKILGKGSVK
ncbi:Outer membrane protein OmpA [Thermoanaerobacter thermohydrosulfuricus]|uniref:Outer membrane protein OmpA n=1 Tax=Thermoanaerobacter thermohydrosulfuricus TaxID=1516 RepID=A0A1G7P0V7_THETY|nr:OmpA family protein [Thermoanaerobacter thermohydrosulfuricus]SDF79936.1 Outer membrane protein OmpA [Thermoanaerobacter thermohydrosulfuricus]